MRRKVFFLLFFATALLILTFHLMNMALRPFLEKTSVYYAKVCAEETLNRTAEQVFSENRSMAEGIVRIRTNESGEPVSATLDSFALGVLKEQISSGFIQSMGDPEVCTVSIPVGTLSGYALFSGVGPPVKMKVVCAGAPSAEIESKFESAGINQTKYSVKLKYRISLYAILPLAVSEVEATYEIPVCEVIIVGSVPEVAIQK
ncbi:MAG TPA: sporulation protein YunB [Oscillospiraceae bacterium]|nr:sporulation protein YunB [Oscillospiraceae bacterium]